MKTATRQAMWAVAAVGLTMGQPKTVHSENTFRVTGVMVNAVTGQKLARVHVRVAPDDDSSQGMETTTGADGGFAFEHLPAGAWTLSAEATGFLRQNYGEHAFYGAWASSVVTGPGGVSENLTFPLNPPAAIKGKVVDANGEPVPDAHIQLLMQVPGARKQFLVRRVVGTDDIGEYRIAGLPPVTCYLLAVVPLPAGGGSGEPSGFAPQYYPNVIDPGAAVPIQLKAGEEFTAEFTLRRAPSFSVRVEGSSGIVGGNNSELLVLLTQGPQGSEVSAGTLGPGQGRIFSNVFPGRYKFLIGDVRSTFATSKWIDVGSEDLTLTLPFPDPPEVTAKVKVVDGDSSLLAKAMLRLHVFADAGYNSRPLAPDGTAVFPAMGAGRYAIALAAPGLYVKSVSARNAKVVDSLVDLPENGPVQLEIVASAGGARVKGKVRADGKPACAALVVLAPARPSVNPDDYRGYQSGSDGSFDFPGIKPGAYTIFATADWQLEYGNPAAIAKYLPAAKPVKAGPKSLVDLQLDLLKP